MTLPRKAFSNETHLLTIRKQTSVVKPRIQEKCFFLTVQKVQRQLLREFSLRVSWTHSVEMKFPAEWLSALSLGIYFLKESCTLRVALSRSHVKVENTTRGTWPAARAVFYSPSLAQPSSARFNFKAWGGGVATWHTHGRCTTRHLTL